MQCGHQPPSSASKRISKIAGVQLRRRVGLGCSEVSAWVESTNPNSQLRCLSLKRLSLSQQTHSDSGASLLALAVEGGGFSTHVTNLEASFAASITVSTS